MTFWFRSVPHDGFLVRAITSFKSLSQELLFLKYQVWKSHQLPSVLLVLPRKLDFFNLLVTDLFTWAKWSMYVVFDLSLKHTTTQGIILIYIFLSQVCVWQILIPDPSKMVQPDPRETMQSQFVLVVIPWELCKWDWICFTAAPSYKSFGCACI